MTNLARQVIFGKRNLFVPAFVVYQRAEAINKRYSATRGYVLKA
jgi:hypothetical protein